MSKTTLLASAATIKAETNPRANTATRVGTMLEDIINESVPYKVYKALLTQTGTSAPTAVILQNTFGATLVITRGGVGDYTITLAGAFTANKTVIKHKTIVMYDNTISFIGGAFISRRVDSDTIQLFTQDTIGGTDTDAILTNEYIEIEVYA